MSPHNEINYNMDTKQPVHFIESYRNYELNYLISPVHEKNGFVKWTRHIYCMCACVCQKWASWSFFLTSENLSPFIIKTNTIIL